MKKDIKDNKLKDDLNSIRFDLMQIQGLLARLKFDDQNRVLIKTSDRIFLYEMSNELKS